MIENAYKAPTYQAPTISPDFIVVGRWHPVVALTVHEQPTVGSTPTRPIMRHTKIRWTMDNDPVRFVTAERWTDAGWVQIWSMQPHTDMVGSTAEVRARSVTAAFAELEPYINMILQP
jgi:hypothetical protein